MIQSNYASAFTRGQTVACNMHCAVLYHFEHKLSLSTVIQLFETSCFLFIIAVSYGVFELSHGQLSTLLLGFAKIVGCLKNEDVGFFLCFNYSSCTIIYSFVDRYVIFASLNLWYYEFRTLCSVKDIEIFHIICIK